jgi:photosystem II stability/assembly factor-like uncharacterized protein
VGRDTAFQGVVLRTVDGGVNWDSLEINSSSLSAVHFMDPDTGIVAGLSMNIFRTTDGGFSWDSIPSGLTNTYFGSQCLYFVDTQNGWLAGSAYWMTRVLKTDDGGLSWDSLTTLGTGVNSIFFVNDSIGWAVGSDCFEDCWGTIHKTTDGGYSWIYQGSTEDPLNAMHFEDGNAGWVFGRNGTILSTTDGGINWQSQSAGTYASLNSVYFTDANTGWVVGDDGVILSTTNPLVSIGDKDQAAANIPERVQLLQNYPNPFNPTTTIEFSLTHSSFVTVKIFNLLGQEVTTLVSKKLPAGSHKFPWDGGSLASGIYFYRLQTEQGFARTKRMLLLK